MLSRGGDTAIQPLTAEAPCKDEARIGQKNKITRRWAKRGSRPSAPRDQRTASSYIFGAICPERGVGAGLVLPWCNSATMSLHLAEISQAVSPGAHAVVLLDQAGWHTSSKLNVPANISLLALPPKSPELNPTENVWQYLRDNWLSNRVFTSSRRYRRSLLRRLEQAHRSTLDHHVHRPSRMGLWVIISEGWYKVHRQKCIYSRNLASKQYSAHAINIAILNVAVV